MSPCGSVVIVDDHAMFRRGVRAELRRGAGVVDVRGRGGRRRRGGRRDRRAPPRRGAARRAPARRRGRRGDAAAGRAGAAERRHASWRSASQRRRRGRHRHHPRRRPRLRHQDHHRARAGRRRSAGSPTGDAVFSPRLAGFVLDAFAGSIDVAAVDEDLDRLTEREREVMRLIARGYAYKEVAKRAVHLDQDRGDPHVERAAQAPALLAPRADPLGLGPPAALRRRPTPVTARGRRPSARRSGRSSRPRPRAPR